MGRSGTSSMRSSKLITCSLVPGFSCVRSRTLRGITTWYLEDTVTISISISFLFYIYQIDTVLSRVRTPRPSAPASPRSWKDVPHVPEESLKLLERLFILMPKTPGIESNQIYIEARKFYSEIKAETESKTGTH